MNRLYAGSQVVLVSEPLFRRALVGVSDYIERKSPVKNSLFLVGGSLFEEHRKISGRSPPRFLLRQLVLGHPLVRFDKCVVCRWRQFRVC